MMKKLVALCLAISFACTSEKKELKLPVQTLRDTSCADVPFHRIIGSYEISSVYAKCEPDWKYRLVLLKNKKIIYQADSLTEFEFKENKVWPEVHWVNKDTVQILMEVNDRPFSNYIRCLTLSNETVLDTSDFPLFENPAIDFDGDSLVEFSGFLFSVEGYTNDSSYYNPLYFVEQSPNGWRIDTSLIRQVNEELYGKFYGMKSSYDIKVKNPPAENLKKYLNDRY